MWESVEYMMASFLKYSPENIFVTMSSIECFLAISLANRIDQPPHICVNTCCSGMSQNITTWAYSKSFESSGGGGGRPKESTNWMVTHPLSSGGTMESRYVQWLPRINEGSRLMIYCVMALISLRCSNGRAPPQNSRQVASANIILLISSVSMTTEIPRDYRKNWRETLLNESMAVEEIISGYFAVVDLLNAQNSLPTQIAHISPHPHKQRFTQSFVELLV